MLPPASIVVRDSDPEDLKELIRKYRAAWDLHRNVRVDDITEKGFLQYAMCVDKAVSLIRYREAKARRFAAGSDIPTELKDELQKAYKALYEGLRALSVDGAVVRQQVKWRREDELENTLGKLQDAAIGLQSVIEASAELFGVDTDNLGD